MITPELKKAEIREAATGAGWPRRAGEDLATAGSQRSQAERGC